LDAIYYKILYLYQTNPVVFIFSTIFAIQIIVIYILVQQIRTFKPIIDVAVIPEIIDLTNCDDDDDDDDDDEDYVEEADDEADDVEEDDEDDEDEIEDIDTNEYNKMLFNSVLYIWKKYDYDTKEWYYKKNEQEIKHIIATFLPNRFIELNDLFHEYKGQNIRTIQDIDLKKQLIFAREKRKMIYDIINDIYNNIKCNYKSA
jgi:ABC-type Zn2+ transport system substrate-binding protein/surface adhesin